MSDPLPGDRLAGERARALHFALEQWRAVYVLVVVLLLAGVFVALNLPEQIYPTLSYSRVLVVAQDGDVAPTLLQSSITRPLEQQLASVLGVRAIDANSTQGTSTIALAFDAHVVDINVALQRVSAAISSLQVSLPKGTSLTIQEVDPSLYPVVGYALRSDRLSPMQLREAAQYQIRPQLLGLPGVSLVGISGGDNREYLVSVDPRRLAARHLTVDQLTTAIAETNTVTSVGHTDNQYVRSTILAMGQAHTANDIANIVIATADGTPITVGSVAAVVETTAPALSSASSNGKPAVIVNVFAQHGASFVGVARTADAAMRAITANTSDIHATRFWNQGTLVAGAIASLRDAILIGLALSTLVLYSFLRNWASTIVAAVVIPATIVITFAALGPLGQSLNLMTLGGLAIGVGLIIDDAIVVVENIYRHLDLGDLGRQAIVAATAEIAVPMISSTLTTIVVFAPLALVSGVPGAFFRALSIALAVALGISLLLALLVTPNVAARFLRRPARRHDAFFTGIQQRYERGLRFALERRAIVLGCAAAILAATVVIGTHLGTDFLPTLDEGAFELEFRLPAGTSLAETRRVAGQIEDIVRSDPGVASEATLVGLTFAATDTPGGVNTGILRATLERIDKRASIDVVMQRIGDRLHTVAPIVQFSTKQLLADMLNELSNTAAPIEIRVFGPEQTTLVPIATAVAARIARVPGISGAFSGVILHNPSLVITATTNSGAFGVTPAQLATDEAVAYGGDIVSSVLRAPLTVPIRVRYDLPLDPTIAQVRRAPIVTPSGDIEPIARLATLVQGPPESEINELNGRQYLAVTAQLDGRDLGSVVAGIKHQLASLQLPPGYSIQIAGAYALQNRSFREFAFALVLSIALVFFVMLVQFRSFLQPLAILGTIPLALFGAVLALYVTKISLNVSSLMGLILLVGLVVKNGILLLEYAHRRQEAGENVREALVYAARVRLRPILMTTLTALLGMVPLAFALGNGSALLQPLAVAVIGGLAFSTLFTLVVIPVLYDALCAIGFRGSPAMTVALIVSMTVGLARPALAQTPLTLGEALATAAALTGSASVATSLARRDAVVNEATASASFGLRSSLGIAPKTGAPAESTLTEELTLDVGSRDGRLGVLHAAQALSAQAQATAANARRRTAQGIVAAFFAVATDQAQRSAATANADLAARSLSAALERHRVGVAPLVDVERARAALATARADVASAEPALANDRATFAALIDRPTVEAVVAPEIFAAPDRATVTALALRTNPDVATARTTLQAAEAALLLARGQLHSSFVVGAGLQVTHQGAQTAVGPALEVGIATPLTRSLGRAGATSAEASAIAARAALVQSERDATQAALRVRAQALSLAERIEPLRGAMDAALDVARAELAGYRLGAVTSSDVVLAQTQLATARNALALAIVQAAQASVTLQLDMGALDR